MLSRNFFAQLFNHTDVDFQYCLNGKCVAEHENIIPDYTQNIPTYVRRDSIFNPTLHNRPIFAQYNNTDYR